MDFRSQLSAFKSKSSNTSNADSRESNSDRGRDSSNNHGNNTSNYNSNNNYSQNRYGSPNRGGSHHDGGYGGDRRRQRPREWNQDVNYNQGPPTARRRFHPPRHGSPGHGYGHGPPNLDGLGDMRNLGYQIPRGFPPVPTEDEKKKKSKHLALLAISIDDLPYENIWKGWCETLSSFMINSDEGVDEYFISLVCHAKFPEKVKSEWLRQRLLTYPPKQGRGNSFMDPVHLSRTPEWGSVEITRAMLDLLQDGLKIGNVDKNSVQKFEDKRFCASRYLVRSPPSFNTSESIGNKIPPVDHFLFISESCLPVVTAPELFSKISDTNVSWLNACHRTEEETPKNKYEDDQFAGINRRIPGQYRWKGDQWVLLSKRHASSIIGIDRPFKIPKHQLWQSFRHINASDEMFFPTALALLGDLRYTKDGYDTQKGRSREEESSQDGAPARNTSGQNLTNDGTGSFSPAANTPATTPSSPPKNQCIILKPVTYTDWTEGMKNPATYSNGPKDLKRVSKLARGMGCLVARKFATHVHIPGISVEERKLTGCISIEEWESIIKEIRSEEEKLKTIATQEEKSASTVVPSEDGNLGTAKTNETEDCTTEGNDDDGDDKTSDSLKIHEKKQGDNIPQDPEDNDNDDGENQLE
jgi:hypothetical protein